MSPNEIKPNDIVINCSVNDKTEINFSNPTNDKKISGFSYKKCILFGIISLIIIGVIIGVVISLKNLLHVKEIIQIKIIVSVKEKIVHVKKLMNHMKEIR